MTGRWKVIRVGGAYQGWFAADPRCYAYRREYLHDTSCRSRWFDTQAEAFDYADRMARGNGDAHSTVVE